MQSCHLVCFQSVYISENFQGEPLSRTCLPNQAHYSQKHVLVHTYLKTVKTLAILPMARILFRMTSFLAATAPPIDKERGKDILDICDSFPWLNYLTTPKLV